MITQEITIDGVTYTVSATSQRGVDEAVEFLQMTLKRAEATEEQEWSDEDSDVQPEPPKRAKRKKD